MKSLLSLTIYLLSVSSLIAQNIEPAFLKYTNARWVDSVMNTLSPEERIAQLFMVAAYSNRDDAHRREILGMIRQHKVGGLVFFQGGPSRQRALIDEFESAAEVPLLVAMDAEWGLGMRLDSTESFPFQMALGAIQNDSLLYEMGRAVAAQLRSVGVHMNFAPVVDINNNPRNPVISYRSFGEDRDIVTRKSLMYMKGMQDFGILATLKHFPGHGDTDTDSHYALPLIRHGRARLDSIEMFPFRELIKAGAAGVMIAHLSVPSLDRSGLPTSLSRRVTGDLLQDSLGFRGLVVTDAMNMRGVTAAREPGVVDSDALLAGSDLIELSENVGKAIEVIRQNIRKGLITQAEIDRRCRKVLAAKYWTMHAYSHGVDDGELLSDISRIKSMLMKGAVTVLRNQGDVLPLRMLDTLRIAAVSVGADGVTDFQRSLGLYTKVSHFTLADTAGSADITILRDSLRKYNLIITGLHEKNARPQPRLGYSPEATQFINELALKDNTLFAVFRNAYVLEALQNLSSGNAVMLAYQDSPEAESATAQVIFGGAGASGRMPVSAGPFKKGEGNNITSIIRLGYTHPGAVGMDSELLTRSVDSLVQQALDVKAIPGCQVLVARYGQVIFNKAYGYHTYSDTIRVKTSDLYDLASVTKVSTSMAALMKLYDEGKFRLDATLGDYLPRFRRSNKADVTLREILAHQGGLIPFIPFYQRTFRKNGSYKWATVKRDSSARFPIRLRDGMFLHRKYPDKMVRGIRKSPLREKKYVYSDFFFMLAPRVVEAITDTPFAEYLRENFYDPLGATSVTFNPQEKYPDNEIVPTENDFLFRRLPVHGTVHDENAAMMRGISGHAGLFANANDLAKLMQMYLNMGHYGSRQFIKEETMREFTRTQFPENNNRRALGFDKPNLKYLGVNNNTAEDASAESFGHTGFTGTFAWMDPREGLLYIFLSNRVTPTRANTRLYQLNTRTQIQQAIYDSRVPRAELAE